MNTDFLSNLFSGGGLNFAALGKVGDFFAIGGMFLAYALIIGIVIFIFKKLSFYKSTANIIVRKGGKTVEVLRDRVREVIDEQGKPVLQCLKLKKGTFRLTCPKPSQKYTYRLKNHNHYFLWLDDNDQMHPVQVSVKKQLRAMISKAAKEEVASINRDNEKLFEGKLKPIGMDNPPIDREIHLRPIPHDRIAWARFEDKRQGEKLRARDRMKEMLVQALPIITLIICFLILFFMFKEIGGGFRELSGGLGQVASSCLGG